MAVMVVVVVVWVWRGGFKRTRQASMEVKVGVTDTRETFLGTEMEQRYFPL